MAESYSVEAVLSAQDKGFSSLFGKLSGTADSFASKLGGGLGFGVMAGIGQKAFDAVSGGLKKLTNDVYSTGSSFETATSQIAATMGKPKEAIEDIIAEAKRLGAETAFTATEAAEGFNVLAMSGLDAQSQIAAMEPVLNLAAAGAYNMDSAASQVVGTLKGFGKEVTDMTNGVNNAQYAADMLAKGATLANTDVNICSAKPCPARRQRPVITGRAWTA